MANLSNIEKFVHRASTRTPSKWLGIDLERLTRLMTKEELEQAIPLTLKAVQEKTEARIKRLKDLDAPIFLIESSEKVLARLKQSKHAHISTLQRALKKRDTHADQ